MFWNSPKKDTAHNESYLQKITVLKAEFLTALETIQSTAQSTIPEWKAYLNTVSITPVEEAHRKLAQTSGLPIPKIAFPSEYRAALVQLESKIQEAVSALDREIASASAEEAAALLDAFVDEHLEGMIETELKRYLDASKPKVSVADIFANAATSMNKYSTTAVGDKSYSIKCTSCGAARLEEDQYDECFYCGTPLFEK